MSGLRISMIVALLSSASPALAQRALPAKGLETVQVRAKRGAIRISVTPRATERGEVVLRSEDTSVRAKGSRLELRGDREVVLELPAGLSVELRSQSGDVQLTGRFKKIRVRTISGDVEVGTQAQEAEIETINGDVKISGTIARVWVSTVNGEVSAEAKAQEARIKVTSGPIRWRSKNLPTRFELRSVSGAQRVEGALEKNASLKAQSISGRLEIVLGKVRNYRIEASSQNGKIEVVDLESKADLRAIDARVGKGEGPAELRLQTLSGRITVR